MKVRLRKRKERRRFHDDLDGSQHQMEELRSARVMPTGALGEMTNERDSAVSIAVTTAEWRHPFQRSEETSLLERLYGIFFSGELIRKP